VELRNVAAFDLADAAAGGVEARAQEKDGETVGETTIEINLPEEFVKATNANKKITFTGASNKEGSSQDWYVFEKEKAKVVRVDKTKGEAVVSLLSAAVPIPVTVKLDNVKVIRRETEEGEEAESESSESSAEN